MTLSSPYFPQLRAQCAPLGAHTQRAAAASESLSGLAALFGRYFPGLLAPAAKGPGSRRRDLPRTEVFWAFLGQVLSRGASCRWALTRLQAAALARGRHPTGDSTSAYCQARQALALSWLQALFHALGRWFEPRSDALWLGRAVRVIDGTGFSMPDTAANRRDWPYAPCQARGCGFPSAKLVGLFCLHTGRLLTFVTAPWLAHDLRLARRLLRWLKPREVLLADRAYCGWEFFALLQRQKTDFVIRLHHSSIPRPSRRDSWWEAWKKPQRRPEHPRRHWEQLPAELLLRLVRFRIQARGFRPKNLIVVTSLLDESAFPDHAIAELYLRRWQVELHFRQIKTNLSLDVLRGLSPAIIQRELWMHALAYNLVRALLLESALAHQLPLSSFSFKGALDALRAWAEHPLARPRHRRGARHALLLRLANDPVPLRPGRHEPRARKRRPKIYPLLTKPRHLMRVGDYR